MLKLTLIALALGATSAAAQTWHAAAHAGPAATSASTDASSTAGGSSAAGTPPAVEHRHGSDREWTRFPLLLPMMGGEAERSAARLRLTGIDAGELLIYGGDAAATPLHVPLTEGRVAFSAPDPQVGNYHWLVARSERNVDGQHEIRVASTAWFFSNPGPAPTAMLRLPKHELEIVPDPLPREHNNYRESDKVVFLVRFKGKPAADQTVVLETEYGSRITFAGDREGRVVVLLPRDFPESAANDSDSGAGHRHGPLRAKFVLAAERWEDGTHYLTALNLAYGADADRGRNLAYGAAFAALGMAAALPLLRRRGAAGAAGGDHA